PPRPGVVVLAREAGPLGVALEVEPKRTTVIVLSPAGGGLSGLSVRLAGNPTTPCGSGCYSAAVFLRGPVRVTVDGFSSPTVATFTIPSHAPSAAATVRRLRHAYRSLPGVTYL